MSKYDSLLLRWAGLVAMVAGLIACVSNPEPLPAAKPGEHSLSLWTGYSYLGHRPHGLVNCPE